MKKSVKIKAYVRLFQAISKIEEIARASLQQFVNFQQFAVI
jgi:hypothetical protein